MQLSPEQQKQLDEQKAQCPFCKLASGEYPSSTIYEDNFLRAVLDIRPSKEGHVLIIPKEHYPISALIPPEEFQHTFKIARDIAKIFKKTLLAFGSNLFVANGGIAGQQVGHFSFHMIPRDSDTELTNFKVPQNTLDQAQYKQAFGLMQQNLAKAMQQHKPQQVAPQEAQQGEATPMNKDQLAQLIDSNQQLKDVIMKKPEYFKESLSQNPQLAKLFAGINIDKLSQALNAQAISQEQQPPPQEPAPIPQPTQQEIQEVEEEIIEAEKEAEEVEKEVEEELQEHPYKPDPAQDVVPATMLTDKELDNLLNLKESLKNLLLEDIDTLYEMTQTNVRLQKFFENTTVAEVAKRVKKIFQEKKKKSIEDSL